MKAVSGKEFAKILERHGWILMRTHGSHHIYGKQDSVVRISIPINGIRPVKIGLLQHFLKMAGLKEADLN